MVKKKILKGSIKILGWNWGKSWEWEKKTYFPFYWMGILKVELITHEENFAFELSLLTKFVGLTNHWFSADTNRKPRNETRTEPSCGCWFF